MTPSMLQLNQAGRKLYIRSQDSSSCSSFFEFDKQEFANKEQVFLFHQSQIIFKGMFFKELNESATDERLTRHA